MIQDTQGNTYSYDADGNLLSSTGGWGTATSTYDALNHRVMYQAGSSTTLYAFNSSGQRSAIYDGSENLLQNQVYWGGTPVAFIKSGTMSFQFQNWVGTAVFNVPSSGSSLSQYISNPYGDGFTTASGTDSDPYHYAGLDGDADGTMHAQFRNYHAVYARWLSPDPYMGSYKAGNPQTFNRYSYARNNPLSRVDRLGLDDDDDDGCDTEQGCSYNEGGGGGGGGGDGSAGSTIQPDPNNPGAFTMQVNVSMGTAVDSITVTATVNPFDVDTTSVLSVGYVDSSTDAPNNTIDQTRNVNYGVFECSGGSGMYGSCQYSCSFAGHTAATDIPLYKIQRACATTNNSCPVALQATFSQFELFGLNLGVPSVVPNSCVYGKVQ